jgi:hypothetical protein
MIVTTREGGCNYIRHRPGIFSGKLTLIGWQKSCRNKNAAAEAAALVNIQQLEV